MQSKSNKNSAKIRTYNCEDQKEKTNVKKGHITAIGLGPGEAELITLKGFKALKNADVAFYPVSSIDNENINSFSLAILGELDINTLVKPLLLPMNSKDRKQNYLKAFNRIKREYDKGCNVVIVSEGDILFYSTFGYL